MTFNKREEGKMEKILNKHWVSILYVFGTSFILQLYCFIEVYSRNPNKELFLFIIGVFLLYTVLIFFVLLLIRRSGDCKNNISRKIRLYLEKAGFDDINVMFCMCVMLLFYSLYYSFISFNYVFFGDESQKTLIAILILVNLIIVGLSMFVLLLIFVGILMIKIFASAKYFKEFIKANHGLI